MRLTNWTDYTLRVLMYCAASAGRAQPVTIGEIAQAHGISHSHLTKVVMDLAAQGLLETTRGRGGGCVRAGGWRRSGGSRSRRRFWFGRRSWIPERG